MTLPGEPESGVAITGVGLVTPLGVTRKVHVERSRRGESAIGPIQRFSVEGHSAKAGAQAPEIDLTSSLRFPKSLKFMNLSVQCAMKATLEALAQSGILLDQIEAGRIAVHTGSGQTGLEYDEFFRALSLAWENDPDLNYGELGGRPAKLLDRLFSLRTLSNAGLALISSEIGARGTSANYVQTDTASAMAIQSSSADLLEGRCDVSVVGGYDALLISSVYLAFEKAGLLSTSDPGEAYRPFDLRRDGLALGEGAAFLVLERNQDACQRGATVLGEILGIGLATETGASPGLPCDPDTFRRAIDNAGVEASEIDFIVARGIGTVEDDRHEAGALASLFGDRVPVTALKSQTGYLGAATAAVELGMGLLCARDGFVPPVARLTELDPQCPLDLVRAEPRPLAKHNPTGLFLSSSWGGQMAAIVARALTVRAQP